CCEPGNAAFSLPWCRLQTSNTSPIEPAFALPREVAQCRRARARARSHRTEHRQKLDLPNARRQGAGITDKDDHQNREAGFGVEPRPGGAKPRPRVACRWVIANVAPEAGAARRHASEWLRLLCRHGK